MRISPIGFMELNKISNLSKKINCTKLQPLKCDSVSFSSDVEKKEPRKAYRCIGESEYKKLIAGEKVKSSGYFSHNPMGWEAESWTDGFSSHKSNTENLYFVTFNYDKFKKDEIELGWNDSKIFKRAYSLDDIINIRKGYNVHGELVWSRNFEEDKQKDVAKKEKSIDSLLKSVCDVSDDSYKSFAIAELASYVQEFPQIITQVEENTDFSNEKSVNNFAELIAKTRDKRFLPEYRKCLQSYLNGVPVEEEHLKFLCINGEKADFDDFMQLINKNDFNSCSNIAETLNNLSTQDDHEKIINRFNTDNPKDLEILSKFYECVADEKDYLDKAQDLLVKCIKMSGTEKDTGTNLSMAICYSTNYMARFGDNNSVELLDVLLLDCPVQEERRLLRTKEVIEERLNKNQ